MEKPIILFGCGKIGQQAVKFIGEDNIAFFADNKVKSFCGRDVLNFDDFITKSNRYITVLTMKREYAEDVAKKFHRYNIKSFVFWDDVLSSLRKDESILSADIQSIVAAIKKTHNLLMDKTSKVEFYLVDAFEISHFLPIYRALSRENIPTRFVAEPCLINTSGEWFDYERATRILRDLGIYFSTMSNSKAAVAITSQYPQNLKYYENAKCLMFYGVNLFKRKLFNLRKDVVEQFDCIFNHGSFGVNKLSEFVGIDRAVDISYPRYKDYFTHIPSKDAIKKDFGITTPKPILLYFPTWDEFSSIAIYHDEIKKLRKDFFVVTKSHHVTYRTDNSKNDMTLLADACDMVLPGTIEPGAIINAADILICDVTSGVFTEVMFLSPTTKMLGLSLSFGKEEFWVDIEKLSAIVNKPEDFSQTFWNIWTNDTHIAYRQKHISEFYSTDISAGINCMVNKIEALIH